MTCRLIEVKVKIGQSNNGFRAFLEKPADFRSRVAFPEGIFPYMAKRVITLLQFHHLFKLFQVVFRNGKLAGLHHVRRAVLGRNAGETLESIEPYDLAMTIKRLINAPQRRKQCQVLTPACAELHDATLDRDNLPVEVIHEENAGEIFRVEE